MKRTLAALIFLTAAGSASATTHVYDLNNSFADSQGGASLVGLGGTLGPTGYSFSANQGLSLDISGLINNSGPYAIEIKFKLDTTSGYRKILDFKSQTSDNGLYAINSAVQLYGLAASGSGVIPANTSVDLLFTRSAAGVVDVTINNVLAKTYNDPSISVFDNNNKAYFFVDDAATGHSEASGGFVDFIKVSNTTSISSVPEASTWAMMLLGFAGLGFAGYRAKLKSAASAV